MPKVLHTWGTQRTLVLLQKRFLSCSSSFYDEKNPRSIEQWILSTFAEAKVGSDAVMPDKV